MKNNLKIYRIITIKFIVGFSLTVSLLVMSVILGIGYAQINSTKEIDNSPVGGQLGNTNLQDSTTTNNDNASTL